MSKKLKRGLFSGIVQFFKAIYSVFDKIIVTPITKVLLFFGGIFRNNDKPFERFLNNRIVLIVLSLILAVVVFITVERKTDIVLNKSADIIYNQEVKAIYNEEAYVIDGLPSKVDITLIGRQSDIYLAKQYPAEGVIVDLRELKPGKHKVKLKYSSRVSSVEYKVDPSTVTVEVSEKISESRTISYDILNERSIDAKYSISNVTLGREEVYIKGAKTKLDEVAVVKALIDVKDISTLEIGNNTIKDVKLMAYDTNGKSLDVEIVPATISATLAVQSPEKKVPLKVIPEGNVVFGKAIDTMVLSKTNVTIYGDAEAISNITSIPVKIDVNGLSGNKEYNVTINKPTGVKDMSVNSVTVKVTLANITESTIQGISIATRNLDSKYTAQAASKDDSSVDVIVKGTSNVIKGLVKDSVTAYVDLTGLKPGTHEVDVIVAGEDLRVTYVPKVKKVKIIIKSN